MVFSSSKNSNFFRICRFNKQTFMLLFHFVYFRNMKIRVFNFLYHSKKVLINKLLTAFPFWYICGVIEMVLPYIGPLIKKQKITSCPQTLLSKGCFIDELCLNTFFFSFLKRVLCTDIWNISSVFYLSTS